MLRYRCASRVAAKACTAAALAAQEPGTDEQRSQGRPVHDILSHLAGALSPVRSTVSADR
jgi:hypothetical protein